jgi:peptide/nickel transport system permease protein
MGVVAAYADAVMVMYAGRVLEKASAAGIFESPQVPYTELLLQATPSLREEAGEPMAWIRGRPPDLVSPPAGCPFHPRCFAAEAKCAEHAPPERVAPSQSDHSYTCWFPRFSRRAAVARNA